MCLAIDQMQDVESFENFDIILPLPLDANLSIRLRSAGGVDWMASAGDGRTANF
jgi:hypothetical protein